MTAGLAAMQARCVSGRDPFSSPIPHPAAQASESSHEAGTWGTQIAGKG